jgi:phosphoserine phosphatase
MMMHPYVLTLIASPASVVDPAAFVSTADAAAIAGITWLSDGEACDVLLRSKPSESAVQQWQVRSEQTRVDFAVLPAENREKKLLISDMDSTLIAQECIDELADALGRKPEVSAITERAMRGELDFEEALRARVGLLAGLSEATLQQVYATRITLMPGAKTLVATMKARGASTHLVSGGFTFFTARVAAALGFDTHDANTLEITGGKLTGTVRAPILGKEAKRALLEKYAAQHNVPLGATLAVGDGANDLPMIQAAGLGVAYHAKPVVADAAQASIRFSDLRALLYLQGIAKRDWVS